MPDLWFDNVVTNVIAAIIVLLILQVIKPVRKFTISNIKKLYLVIKKQTLSYKLDKRINPLEERISKLNDKILQLESFLQQKYDKRLDEVFDKSKEEFSRLKEANQKSIKALEDKANELISQYGKDSEKEIREAITNLKGEIDRKQRQTDLNILLLRGEIYRTLAYHFESEKSFATSFLWYMRYADVNSILKNYNFAKGALASAISCLNEMSTLSFGRTEHETEMLSLIDKIKQRDKVYKLEIEQIEKLFKEKKFPSKSPITKAIRET